MDGMDVDNASKCRKYKNKRINLIFSKNCNHNWEVSQKSVRNTFTTVPNPTPKPKPSLKVSLPIIHYLNAMQRNKNNASPGMNMPSPDKTEARRVHFGIPPMTPLPLSPSSLRMFRHPVPTSKGRLMLVHKQDQIVKIPEPTVHKETLKFKPSIPHTVNTSTIKEPAKKKTEELNTSECKSNTTVSANYGEPISIKHKLPLTLVAPKGSYGIRSSNPINKENRLSTSNNTQATVVQATQTEKVFLVTEQGYQILEKIKNSGLTPEDLQNQIDNFNKQREKNNDEDCTVIDLERTEDSTSKDVLETVMKHSINNKNVLNRTVEMMQLLGTQNGQLSAPVTGPTPERTASTLDQQTPLAEPVLPAECDLPPFSFNPFPHADMVKSLIILSTLQKFGYHLTRTVQETPQTPIPQQTNSQTTQTSLHIEDENNNSKNRKRHATVDENFSDHPLANHLDRNNFERPSVVTVRPAQEVPVLVPQQREAPVFPPQMQTRQPPQTQILQFGAEHVERPVQLFPSNLPSLMPQQHNQFTMPRNHPQYPCDIRSSALSSPQIVVQAPVQLHRNNSRRQTMQNRLGGLPRLSRVLSTQEANMHGQAAQHPDWSFPQYFDRHGNVFPQRHQ